MRVRFVVLALTTLLAASAAWGEIPEEFRIAREPVYQFAQKPAVKAEGEKLRITFAAKANCDVAVAIMVPSGKTTTCENRGRSTHGSRSRQSSSLPLHQARNRTPQVFPAADQSAVPNDSQLSRCLW